VKRFESCGIFPLNPSVFSDDDFSPSLLTDEGHNTSLPASASLSVLQTVHPNDLRQSATTASVDVSAIGSCPAPQVVQPIGPRESTTSDDLSAISESTSSQAVPSVDVEETDTTTSVCSTIMDSSLEPQNVLPSESVLLSGQGKSATAASVDTVSEISFTEASQSMPCQSPIPESCSPVAGIIRDNPLPKATLRIRKRKPEAAEILTSSPYKKTLVEKESLRKSLKPPQPKQRESKDCGKKNKSSGPKRKLTVRQDKPRGRRPKANTGDGDDETKKVTPARARCYRNKSRPRPKVSEVDDLAESCGGCGERFLVSTDDWLQCRHCGLK